MGMKIGSAKLTARLEDSKASTEPGYIPPLTLTRSRGFAPQTISFGFPEVRKVVDKRPNTNGTFDFTSKVGARTVQLVVGLAEEMQALNITDTQIEDSLMAWMYPSVRAWLIWRRDDRDDERRVLVRGSSSNRTLNLVRSNNFDQVSCVWDCPMGLIESNTLYSETLTASTTSELGRAYDLTFDRTYPSSAPVGTRDIYNLGTAPSVPYVTIYGPCVGPVIENLTTGKKIQFDPAYSLLAGEFLSINFVDGTVLLNNNPANSRYDKIDFSVSNWWDIQPGIVANKIRFKPVSFTDPSRAVVEYRYTYI